MKLRSLDPGHLRVAAVFLILLIVSGVVPSRADSQESQTGSITAVTVYPGLANVERTVALPEGKPGQRSLMLGPLPASFRDRSIRVTAEGDLQVLSVKVQRTSGDPVEPQRLKELRQRLEEARQALQALQRQDRTLASLQARYRGMVPGKPEPGKSGPLSLDSWKGLTELILRGVESTTDQRNGLAPKILQADALVQQLNQELQQFEKLADRRMAHLEISTLDEKGTGGVFRIEYQIPGATWIPAYEAHVQGDRDLLQLRSYAEVRQWTGEDWPAVPMSFSTSLPESGAEPEELAAIKIERPRFLESSPVMSPRAVPQPEVSMDEMALPKAKGLKPAQARKRAQPAAIGGLSGEMGKAFFYAPSGIAQEPLDDRGFLTVFEAVHAEGVASNGSPHRRLYSLASIPFTAVHRCVPELETAVFRRLKMPLPGEDPLLAGPVSVFAGADYLGLTQIDRTVAPGEDLTIDLGILDQMGVQRFSEESEETRGILSRVIEYRTETVLKIENFGSEAESIEVMERIPVTDDEQVTIAIDEGRTEPKPLDMKPADGILRWDLTVQPGETFEVRLVWTMQIPKDKRLRRWDAPDRLGEEQ